MIKTTIRERRLFVDDGVKNGQKVDDRRPPAHSGPSKKEKRKTK